MLLTTQTLGMNDIIFSSQLEASKFTILNEFVKKRYLEYFTNLLNYFKTF